MTEAERAALIGNALQEHKDTRQKLGCLNAKADRLMQNVTLGTRLIKGETTGHLKDGGLFVAESSHSMMVKECVWPSREEIGALVEDRTATEKRLVELEEQLRSMGMGDYVKGTGL